MNNVTHNQSHEALPKNDKYLIQSNRCNVVSNINLGMLQCKT